MSKSLIITEKPSVAKDIAAALGGFESKQKGEYFESDEFVCTYAVGHVLSLLSPEELDPKYKRWRLADLPILPEEFKLKPIERQKARVKLISKLINRKDVTTLINACDAAREGELIFRELVDYTESKKPIQRLWLQSMTKTAIRDGFAALKDGSLYEGLGAAAACRSYSDWLIGMNATRALTVRLKTRSERGLSWSAGRVQTPTLAILVKRELEVLNHNPVPYFKIEARFAASDHQYDATWFSPSFKKDETNADARENRIFDEKIAAKIVEKVSEKKGLASEQRKPRSRKAPLLFDLTSLQREANNRFSWSAVRTLRAAQRCYEAHKVLTYPRTSSKALPEDYREVVKKLLETLSEDKTYKPHAKYLIKNGLQNDKLVFNDAAVSDHFAIIPTGEIKNLEGDDAKLFDLVTRQFMAVFYPPAIYEDVVRITEVEGETFKSRPPSVLKDPGWLAVFDKQEQDGVNFPPLAKGKDKIDGVAIKNTEIKAESHFTKPPPRIGEAGLLGLMENAGRHIDNEDFAQALQAAEGLGTAATRADIIENLKAREYVDAQLRPAVKGIRLIDVLQRIKADSITSAELTGRLELHLSEVESGKRKAESFIDEVKAIATQVVEATRDFDFDEIYPNVDPIGPCPKCKEPVFEKAWFYGCHESTRRSDTKKTCEVLFWKDNFGRYMDRRTIRLLLTEGTAGEVDGFKNSNGQSYKAVLNLDGYQIVRKPVAGSEEESPDLANIEINAEPLGVCPLDDHEKCLVIETKAEFVCQTRHKAKAEGQIGKGFSIPRFICKREMKREEVLPFLEKKETELLSGFISKKGRPFQAKLKLDETTGRFQFEFPERKPRAKKKKDEEEESN